MCEWSICGTWAYPECPLRRCPPSLSLSSCLRPSPPSSLCSVKEETSWTATGFERFGCLTREKGNLWKPFCSKGFFQQPAVRAVPARPLFFVDTNSIRRDNLRGEKSLLICQVLVSCWRSRVCSCSDAKIRASDVFTDRASPRASLLCVLLQEAPAVWQTWKASAAVTRQNLGVLRQSGTSDKGGKERRGWGKQRVQKVINKAK